MRTVLSLLLLLTIDASLAHAQFTIHVVDKSSGEPVAFPMIELVKVTVRRPDGSLGSPDFIDVESFDCDSGYCTTQQNLPPGAVQVTVSVSARDYVPASTDHCYSELINGVTVKLEPIPFEHTDSRDTYGQLRCTPSQFQHCCRVPPRCRAQSACPPLPCSPCCGFAPHCELICPQSCFGERVRRGQLASARRKRVDRGAVIRRPSAATQNAWKPVPSTVGPRGNSRDTSAAIRYSNGRDGLDRRRI